MPATHAGFFYDQLAVHLVYAFNDVPEEVGKLAVREDQTTSTSALGLPNNLSGRGGEI